MDQCPLSLILCHHFCLVPGLALEMLREAVSTCPEAQQEDGAERRSDPEPETDIFWDEHPASSSYTC